MFLIRAISRLPLSLLYLLADIIFLLTYYVVRYRRKTVKRNLKNSFPEKSDAELRQTERDFYKRLCDYGVETLKLYTIKKSELSERMRFNDVSIIEKFKRQNQSVLILASHQFNWEWLLTAGNFALPVPVDFVYQPVNSKSFNDFSLVCRTRFGAYPIKRDEVARETIKRKKLLRGVAIVADQYPGHKNDKRYATSFLNQDTVFFLGAHQLAQITQYPVVFAQVKRLKRGYYEASFVQIGEPPYAKEDFTMLENYVREVEKVIYSDPSGWLWSHNRWKTRHLNSPEAGQ